VLIGMIMDVPSRSSPSSSEPGESEPEGVRRLVMSLREELEAWGASADAPPHPELLDAVGAMSDFGREHGVTMTVPSRLDRD
jgi:hypothetical protein